MYLDFDKIEVTEEFKKRAEKIKLVIMDVDGVLTDGGIYYDSEGRELKRFCVKDGSGVKMLWRAGLKTAIITGRNSTVVDIRAKELKVDIVIQGAVDKLPVYKELKEKLGITDEEILYIGDDYLDIPLLSRVGLAVCVPEAYQMVRDYCHYVTKSPGGNGAVREIAELLLRVQGKLDTILEKYFR